MAALLLAVAQQEKKHVVNLGVRPGHQVRLAPIVASEAAHFVASEGFAEWCEMLNLNTYEYRTMDPAKAYQGYHRLVSDDFGNDIESEGE